MNLSVFRYPGGKSKLISILGSYINDLKIESYNAFCDAFVGGGSVLLSIAEKYPNIKLYANDKDFGIASFWQIVSSSDTLKLQELLKLMEQPVTLEHFNKLRQAVPSTDVDAAYQAIFFNRTTFSGIASSGPIGGKEQKSKYKVDCRYNFTKLKQKILKCNKLLSGRTDISNVSFSEYSVLHSDIPTYVDPPYYIKGDSLYTEKMSPQNHQELFEILNNKKNWVLSYDDHPFIKDLYKDHTIIDLAARYCINGNKESWEHKNELIITC